MVVAAVGRLPEKSQSGGGGGGGSFLTCEDLGERFNNSFLACTRFFFFLFFKVEINSCNEFHIF